MLLPFEKVSPHERNLREYLDTFELPAGGPPLGRPVCIMLFTNRSGSSLVSEHMRASPRFTGFGEPLNFQWIRDRCEKEGLRSFGDYLRFESNRLHSEKPGAIMGMKASYGQAMMLLRSGAIPHLFDDVRWVVIQRQDLLAQAISYAIADQTKRWHSFDTGEAVEPVYDFDDIKRRLQGFAHSYMAINTFCATFEIQPYRLRYEEFSRDPVAGAKKLAAWLGVKRMKLDKSLVQMARQRNRDSTLFRERFARDLRESLQTLPEDTEFGSGNDDE